ncbi:hypothetical protein SNE40_010692 [Patella caerulea]
MFKKKSTWTPPPYRDKHLESYLSICDEEIMKAPDQKFFLNLSQHEREALSELRSDYDIVIREADKGSGVVVMDKARYLSEGYRQLDDLSVYRRTDILMLPNSLMRRLPTYMY